MHTEHETSMAWLKIAIAWIGATLGGVTLSTVALLLTIGFTGLQIYILIRNLRRDIRLEKLEAKLKHEETK